ncbi:hypothetical protein SYNPS1DRAFT_29355 [Syncephalis pseudoplumigaleata]|uniref:Uncharacterized protein n=1 Tax=Syncephalis pseudoplumigaleata TaxID=1712513 RepID=A0A4P9YZQ3_9FUNG|nr:hypothetical protein SYNPS1DRAFT_29355 [Syncephalis pseudoplumigaleata]|eukprot:RKP24901.1 hypothetical protein SYNPS1DRAFT_29355 [Syncephalis pseudoplumigaleata]
MHLPTASTFVLGVVVALAGTMIHSVTAQNDPTKNLDQKKVELVNDNGPVVLVPYFEVAQPRGTDRMLKTTSDATESGAERLVYLDANSKFLRLADIYRSDERKDVIEKIEFIEPDPHANANRTATVTMSEDGDTGNINKIDIAMFDDRRERVSLDYDAGTSNVKKIVVERLGNKDDKTELEVGYDIFGTVKVLVNDMPRQQKVSEF